MPVFDVSLAVVRLPVTFGHATGGTRGRFCHMQLLSWMQGHPKCVRQGEVSALDRRPVRGMQQGQFLQRARSVPDRGLQAYHLKNPWLKSPCCSGLPAGEKTDILGLHKDSRKNGHSLSECCNGVVFRLCQLRGHRIGCSRLRQQHSAYKYRYQMGSWPSARRRRALGRIIPPKTARIICESTSIQGLWPLLQESLCNPRFFQFLRNFRHQNAFESRPN